MHVRVRRGQGRGVSSRVRRGRPCAARGADHRALVRGRDTDELARNLPRLLRPARPGELRGQRHVPRHGRAAGLEAVELRVRRRRWVLAEHAHRQGSRSPGERPRARRGFRRGEPSRRLPLQGDPLPHHRRHGRRESECRRSRAITITRRALSTVCRRGLRQARRTTSGQGENQWPRFSSSTISATCARRSR